MSERDEALWVVTGNDKPSQVFRSRSTARAWVEAMKSRHGSTKLYRVHRVTWGPERLAPPKNPFPNSRTTRGR